MEPLAHGAIRFPHRGDLREHGAFPFRLVRGRLQLLGALLHRGSFLVRESLGRLAGRGGALGGLLRGLRSRLPLSHGVFLTSCAPAALSRGPELWIGAPPLTLVGRRARACDGPAARRSPRARSLNPHSDTFVSPSEVVVSRTRIMKCATRQ